MGKMTKDLDVDNDSFKHIEAIIHSMTPMERSNPSLLNSSRKKRIAMGSGRSIQEVNQLLKQFTQMSKMMKMMQGGGARNMMRMMQQQGGRPNENELRVEQRQQRHELERFFRFAGRRPGQLPWGLRRR